ncbi:TetR/AcrR family transcriptional regulator [Amycolatopsis jiangsuensis]|uniref:AcrR family transcriptional regulator n=1 Tax=Amycolatopsis jiangsuensis TaxID=1181879 RepID=A0A840J5J0_9PSEU|nr:TetR/AcrR family transcriptional regulator [Amycolatopsis jiangsuensis]MBB4688885.1 AcrR family transcriptional regulator [Amycolatopsis jiangsuensis]
MTSPPLRKDAARNWKRIVETARHYLDEGRPLQLNDVARTASIGVATVYRHFPTPEALLETVAAPAFEALAEHAEQTLADPDPWQALRGFLAAGIEAQLTDASVSPVFTSPTDTLERTTELKQRVTGLFGQLLDRVHAAGTIDPEFSQADLVSLMCGVAHAVHVHTALAGAEPVAVGRRYLDLLLTGLQRP